MKITNQDICKMLEKYYGQNWEYCFCGSIFVFRSARYAVSIMATKGKLEDFEKVMSEIDWVDTYKHQSMPVSMKEKCEWKLRKVCIFNSGKENEVRFVMPQQVELLIEKTLEKPTKTKDTNEGLGGK